MTNEHVIELGKRMVHVMRLDYHYVAHFMDRLQHLNRVVSHAHNETIKSAQLK